MGRRRILDYACGTGSLTGHLLNEGLDVAACDLSSDSLAIVRERYQNHPNFIGVSAPNDLKMTASPFDAVLLVELIEHVDDATLSGIFAEVKGALRPGGLIVVTTPNDENLQAETVYCPSCNHTFHRWQHVRSWSADSLADIFRTAGIDVVEIFATDFSLSRKNGSLRYLLRRVSRAIQSVRPPHLVGIGRLAG